MLDFAYDGVDLTDKLVVEKIDRPFVVSENSSLNIPGYPGELFRKNQLGSKTINVSCRLFAENLSNLLELEDELKKILIKPTPRKLVLRDRPDKYDLAILDGTMGLDKMIRTGLLNLSFLSPSGLSYSSDISDGTNNIGTAPTPWILKGVASGGQIKISDTKHGLTVVLDDDFLNTDDEVEIDAEQEIIKINGNLNMHALYFESAFWDLKIGENEIKVEGLSSYDIKYRARWL